MKKDKIGFIGGGNMAEALVKGLAKDYSLIVSDISIERRNYLVQKYGVSVTPDNTEVVHKAEIIILAVKPNHVDFILKEIKPTLSSSHLVISIAAGISTAHIHTLIGEQIKVIRVMPNTPALVAEGMTVIASDSGVSKEDLVYGEKIFSTVGKIVKLEEKYIDAATALSGSGPGFIFVIIEALIEGGVKIGLPRPVARELTLQTIFGSAHMAILTNKHPSVLKEMVTSPGGTTITGIHVLEQMGLRGTLMNAVEAAALKADQLGKKSF
jgi:pyrroline-5-carboxylate reductase